jgi:hypothetical protein
VLQILYTVRSERQLMEHLDYNRLFRWFVGRNMDEAGGIQRRLPKNHQRLLDGNIAQAFFEHVLARARQLLSTDHFTVAHMYRKGPAREAKLCYMGHVLMENRHGLVMQARATIATATAETDMAEEMVELVLRAPDVLDEDTCRCKGEIVRIPSGVAFCNVRSSVGDRSGDEHRRPGYCGGPRACGLRGVRPPALSSPAHPTACQYRPSQAQERRPDWEPATTGPAPCRRPLSGEPISTRCRRRLFASHKC